MSRILIALLFVASLAISSASVITIPPLILTLLTNLANNIIVQAFAVPVGLSACAAQKVQIIIASFNDLVEDIVEDLPNEITLANLPNWITQEMAEINNATAFVDPTCIIAPLEQATIGIFVTFAQGYIAILSFIFTFVVSFIGSTIG